MASYAEEIATANIAHISPSQGRPFPPGDGLAEWEAADGSLQLSPSTRIYDMSASLAPSFLLAVRRVMVYRA